MLGAHGKCTFRGGSIGAASMAVILTNEFDGSESITAANEFAIPRRGPTSEGFRSSQPARDLFQTYTAVFVLAVASAASTLIPVVFLPKRPPGPTAPLAGK
jgi:hypothetical protein